MIMPSESLDEDTLSHLPESEASLIDKQARSELLDRVANFCDLERGNTEKQKWVIGMKLPLYHNPGSREFFMGVGYHTHNLEGIPSPESLVIPSKPPPTERTVEDQPFCLEHKHPAVLVNGSITSGLFSLRASQLKEHKALARKTAAAFSNALSISEYVYNQPEISEESRVGLKLDLVAGANFPWRMVHNHMLMRHSVALDNLKLFL